MADEELKVLLRENIEVSKESLKILKKINRGRIFGNIFTTLKWMLIIGISFGAYYYIEPYFTRYINLTKGLISGVENVSKTSNNVNSATSPNLMNKLQGLMPK